MEKRKGTRTCELTGLPSFRAGENDQRLTAEMAVESRTRLPEELSTRTEPTRPLLLIWTSSNTRPYTMSRRAVSG